MLFIAACACVVFFTAIVLLLRRKEHSDRSRIFFGIYTLITGTFMFRKLWQAIFVTNTPPSFHQSLDTSVSIAYYLVVVLFLLYVIELKRPNWLRWRHVGLMLAPWAVLTSIFLLWCGDNITILRNHTEVLENIGKPDVWMRLILNLLAVPFAVWCTSCLTTGRTAVQAANICA